MNDPMDVERERMQAENLRRAREVDSTRYAAWQPSAALARASRVRDAAQLLKGAGVFPTAEAKVLEVGCGALGWMPDLLAFGVHEASLSGIDLDRARVEQAHAALPAADLRVGDASRMPWPSETFALVVASTVFSSILSAPMKQAVAGEIVRVLKPGGALLWYDFAFNNPNNPHVRGVKRAELRRLFPTLRGTMQRATLAPPLARLVAPRSNVLAGVLEAIPVLRTHLLAVLVKHDR